MHERYAVLFSEHGGGAVVAGALEVRDDRLLLEGTTGGGQLGLSVPMADIAEVRIGRLPADRLNGSVTLVFERRRGPAVRMAPLGAGLLHEIADLVSGLTGQGRAGDELAVVVPLKPNCLARARTLLQAGPPLDPAALGLTSHQVYLRESEAVFVFRGANVSSRVAKAMRSPALWRAGLAWQECIAGQPSIHRSTDLLPSGATPVYTWPAAHNHG